MTETDGLLFDPNTYDPQQFDDETHRLLRATIDWFEGQGKKRLLDDDLAAQWAVGAIRKPVPDASRFGRVWERVKAYDGAYEMRS